MPEAKLFQSWYPPEAERQIRCHLEELSAEFNVPLIDARNWVEDDAFVDGQHLRPAGASQFSSQLAQEVLEPVLAMPREEWAGYLASTVHQGELNDRTIVAGRPILSPDTPLRR
jgi:hypothetical protein